MTNRIGDILEREIERLRRNLGRLEAGLAVSGDDPDKDKKLKELLQDLGTVSANIERHEVIKAKQ